MAMRLSAASDTTKDLFGLSGRFPFAARPFLSRQDCPTRLLFALRYSSKAESVEEGTGLATLDDAVDFVQKEAKANFTETVEIHVKLATDPKRSDHIVRGSAVLPHGTGKQSRLAVFCDQLDQLEKAKEAGADVVGGGDLIDSIKKGSASIDWDVAIATPGIMPKLASIARVLGPKGLMPNPKKGTVTDNVIATIGEFRKGRVDFRQDKGAVIHAGLAKVNFNKASIVENVAAFFGAVMLARPKGVKGSGAQGFIKTVSLCSTMGRSIRVSVPDILNMSVKVRRTKR